VKTMPQRHPQLSQHSSIFFRLSKSYFSSRLKPQLSMKNSELDGQKPDGVYPTTSHSIRRDKSRTYDTCSSSPAANRECKITHYAFKNSIDRLS